MDWLKEILGKLVTDEEKKDEIVEKASEEIRKGIGTRFVAKDDFNKKNNLAKELKLQIKEKEDLLSTQNSQLEKLQESAGIDEELKKQIEALKIKNQEEIDNLKLDFDKKELAFLIESEIRNYSPHDVKAVLPFLDMSIVKKDNDKIIGLKEQMEEIQQNKAFLFPVEKETKPKDNIPPSTTVNPGGNKNLGEPDFSKMTDKEYYEYRNKK